MIQEAVMLIIGKREREIKVDKYINNTLLYIYFDVLLTNIQDFV